VIHRGLVRSGALLLQELDLLRQLTTAHRQADDVEESKDGRLVSFDAWSQTGLHVTGLLADMCVQRMNSSSPT